VEGKRRQFQIEKKYRHKDGSLIWVSNNVSFVLGTERVPRFVMTLSENITECKRVEDALRESEAFLLDAQRLTRTCSWRHEVSSGKVTISPEGLVMYGIEPEDDASSADFNFRRMHPKDRPEVEQAYAAALLRKTDFEADFRIVRPDGTIINTRSIGHPILDERDNVVEFVGASTDVTEHHRAQQALRRSEAYLAEAQRLAKTGSWAYDPVAEKGIYWSDEMLRMCGLDPQRSNFPDGEEFLRLMNPEDPWPGNIRELQNVVERSVIVSSDGVFCWMQPGCRGVPVESSSRNNLRRQTPMKTPVVSGRSLRTHSREVEGECLARTGPRRGSEYHLRP
jgi:PAS domain S-box-containing protein